MKSIFQPRYKPSACFYSNPINFQNMWSLTTELDSIQILFQKSEHIYIYYIISCGQT